MKTIICLIGRQNSGKTSSIREVYKSITGNYPDEEGDFNGTYQHPEFGNIGFSSWGDPGANEEPLDEILQMNCDFVISACRSKGQTIEVVEKFLFISLKHFSKKKRWQEYLYLSDFGGIFEKQRSSTHRNMFSQFIATFATLIISC